jgi:DNA-binding response OmpR family regulator
MSEINEQPAGIRVLIVDDNVDSAKMMKMILKLNGYEARTAYDGVEAITAAVQFKPEIILLDLGLPRKAGQDVALELRQDHAMADTLIIAISGYSDIGVPPGIDHLLVKPVDHERLMSLLEERKAKEHIVQSRG